MILRYRDIGQCLGKSMTCCQPPTMPRTSPCSKELSRPNISVAKVEKCLFKVISYPSKANEIFSSEAFEDSNGGT